MLIEVLVLWLQAASMDDLIRELGHEDIEKRQRASERILERWKSWTDTELAALEAATRAVDAETAKKAADALATIRFHRGFPERVRAAFPEAARILRGGTPDEVAGFFDALLPRWEQRELTSLDVLPLVMLSLDDERKTTRAEAAKGGVWYMPASFPARTLLHAILPRFYYNTPPADVRAWWAAHRAEPEREWYIPDLAAKDERHRAGAIQRLFALGDPADHPKLFASLRTIKEEYSVEIALKHAAELPADVLRRELKPYLPDPRLNVCFLAAKLLHPTDPREALDALSLAFERDGAGHWTELHEIVEWMTATQDARAFASIRRFLKAGDFHSRSSVISALGSAKDDRVDEVLIGMFGDTDRTSGRMLWGDVRNPRICDQAGILLARRQGLGDYEWPEDRIALRNANLAKIWKAYREKKGLPPAPFLPPGATIVAPEQVADLRPDLLSKDAEVRKTAIKKLSAMGSGAWPRIQEEALKDVALAFSNTLRRVDGNAAALDAVKRRLHEPFDPDLFFREAVAPWFDDPQLAGISVLITREPEGGGIALRMELTPAEPGAAPFDQFSGMSSGGGGFLAWMRRPTYDQAWTKFFAPLKEDMAAGRDAQFKDDMRMSKTRSK